MIVSIYEFQSQIWPPWDIQIKFNGITQKHCVYADDSQGIIKRYVTDKNGKISTGFIGIEVTPLIETLQGDVQILHGDK